MSDEVHEVPGVDDETSQRYRVAKAEYQKLLKVDFPDFDPTDSVNQGTRSSTSPTEDKNIETAKSDNPVARAGHAVGRIMDLSGDGKVDMDDVKAAPSVVKNAISGSGRKVSDVTAGVFGRIKQSAESFDRSKMRDTAQQKTKEFTQTIEHVHIDTRGIAAGVLHIGGTATGVQGLRDRKEAKDVLHICHDYYDAAEAVTEQRRKRLNFAITDFGTYRLRSLHVTVGRFLNYLDVLKQRNARKEYEILADLSIDTRTLGEMKGVDMEVSKVLETTAVAGAAGAVAVLGTPALITGAVGTLATASTGTAIASLSGVAASNATLAWLGGGSLAAGGGGMVAGAAALTTITAGATGVVALLSVGTIASAHYSKKLTEAKEYEKNVGIVVAGWEKAWAIMEGISVRVSELREVTEELRWRTVHLLDELEPLIPEFDFNDKRCVTVFNKCGRFIKTMAELAQTPLLCDDGNLTDESLKISATVRKVINTEV
ncbi:hypothetical protein [Bifidobacterium tibiigranuli]|jgi:hypothetical protein|uniref:hypothetical protein n=1 Tax=Bifidobacterium tibiigranuli TaxID=2172043 RepID=UPI002353E4FE|nr:hypothetical protein [Bifidobacterium tibiigranuli]MCI1211113.1 hypothetical protein [Bifidobacterium tibiigranuli]MCI1220377.1 hypothetical protein [Bifidobacterium tibiigranuli]MCI1231941.1 hypothetical protein [Bifidobacterium tibiigranuli]